MERTRSPAPGQDETPFPQPVPVLTFLAVGPGVPGAAPPLQRRERLVGHPVDGPDDGAVAAGTEQGSAFRPIPGPKPKGDGAPQGAGAGCWVPAPEGPRWHRSPAPAAGQGPAATLEDPLEEGAILDVARHRPCHRVGAPVAGRETAGAISPFPGDTVGLAEAAVPPGLRRVPNPSQGVLPPKSPWEMPTLSFRGAHGGPSHVGAALALWGWGGGGGGAELRPRIPACIPGPARRWRRQAWSRAQSPPRAPGPPHTKAPFFGRLPAPRRLLMPGSAHPACPGHATPPQPQFPPAGGRHTSATTPRPRPRSKRDSLYPRRLQTPRLCDLGQNPSFLGPPWRRTAPPSREVVAAGTSGSGRRGGGQLSGRCRGGRGVWGGWGAQQGGTRLSGRAASQAGSVPGPRKRRARRGCLHASAAALRCQNGVPGGRWHLRPPYPG